ncbi:hypothetical protein [Nonomuraea endophytica]|uniref:Transmembrane transport protein n=1 Tax=Nonomuraea endophytica TaxID=714136 RepID=A0A7W7ZYF5_9ACTN|nr:hypothetical protein [Nonomuraea endophytica]MBB5076142.1 hypothetical protein [Nonomuraea endophytica]
MNSPDDIIARLSPVLSPWRRVGGLTALIAGLAGAVALGALWLTEPEPLPDRLHLGFGLLLALCLVWAGYGGWVLARRTPMFALDRVVAGWLAVAASTLTAVFLAVVGVVRDTPVLFVVGPLCVAVAAVVTFLAHRRRNALLRRKAELS